MSTAAWQYKFLVVNFEIYTCPQAGSAGVSYTSTLQEADDNIAKVFIIWPFQLSFLSKALKMLFHF